MVKKSLLKLFGSRLRLSLSLTIGKVLKYIQGNESRENVSLTAPYNFLKRKKRRSENNLAIVAASEMHSKGCSNHNL